jgi:hypothetical protein
MSDPMAIPASTPSRGAGSLALAVRFAHVDPGVTVTPRHCARCHAPTADADLWILLPRVQLACEQCKDAWLEQGAPVF